MVFTIEFERKSSIQLFFQDQMERKTLENQNYQTLHAHVIIFPFSFPPVTKPTEGETHLIVLIKSNYFFALGGESIYGKPFKVL